MWIHRARSDYRLLAVGLLDNAIDVDWAEKHSGRCIQENHNAITTRRDMRMVETGHRMFVAI